MGAFSIWHWLIVLVVVLVLFGGKGKISSLMGDFGRGLKSFKKNVKDDAQDVDSTEPSAIESNPDNAARAEPTSVGKDQATNS
ncbi:MAG: twin-arginine translocase TatA/TatE family subunit [Rhodospirillaceae bacterium]|jgi:sec-independent protein translocase protein TatA|nr:twin-arginine translocase TatA/TatE family subunit [Rhodospirillaceae bacterium]